MIAEVNEPKIKKEILINKSKIYKYMKSKLIFVVIATTIVLLFLSFKALEMRLYNIQIKDIISIEQLRVRGILTGAFIGSFLGVFVYMWFENRNREKVEKEKIKNYARILKADMDRTTRLFKNKRFTLLKINRISVLNDWLDMIGKVSLVLTKNEIQQLISYYTEIDRLSNYENEINRHIDTMQCTVLKDYPYIKEYNDLLTTFGVEVNTLFRIDIEDVKVKLDKIS